MERLNVELLPDQPTEGRSRPELLVVWIASPWSNVEVLAAGRVGKAEPRFVRDAQHNRAPSNARQLGKCLTRQIFGKVLQYLETSDDIE